MARWIAFDQKTVSGLRQQLPREQVFEHGARSVVDYVMGGPDTLVTVLPLGSGGAAAVAVFRKRKAQAKVASPAAQPDAAVARPTSSEPEPGASKAMPVQVRPGGFLGLWDETVFEEERKPQKKKKWWQRFWDDEDD